MVGFSCLFSHVVMSHFRKVESADPVMTKTEKDKIKLLEAQTLINQASLSTYHQRQLHN